MYTRSKSEVESVKVGNIDPPHLSADPQNKGKLSPAWLATFRGSVMWGNRVASATGQRDRPGPSLNRNAGASIVIAPPHPRSYGRLRMVAFRALGRPLIGGERADTLRQAEEAIPPAPWSALIRTFALLI
jgi:hypothetical protein